MRLPKTGGDHLYNGGRKLPSVKILSGGCGRWVLRVGGCKK